MTHYQERDDISFGEATPLPHQLPWIARSLLLPWVGFFFTIIFPSTTIAICFIHRTNSFYTLFVIVCVFIHRSVCTLGALFVWLVVPETSGKTLSQLASLYKKD